MSKSAPSIHDLFRACFPPRARTELVRSALTSHTASKALVRQMGFSPEQARDVTPYVFRAHFENQVATLTIPSVAVSVRRNHRGTSSFVELTTDGASLTALTRSRPPTCLSRAHYRETRAEGSQVTIFEILGASKTESTAPLYGTFVYGGGSNDLSLARVYFPIPGAHLLTIPPLDLLAEHHAVLATMRAEAEESRPMEQIAQIAIGLKKKAETEGGEE